MKPNIGRDLSIPFRPPPPDGITFTNNPLESIIRYAYSVQPFRVVGLPAWTREERFDIAKAAGPISDAERRLMMRALSPEGALRNPRADHLCHETRAGGQTAWVRRDETGIVGTFDVELSWRPEGADANDERPAFVTAMQEQLGLKLEPQRRPVEMLVIESLDRPIPD